MSARVDITSEQGSKLHWEFTFTATDYTGAEMQMHVRATEDAAEPIALDDDEPPTLTMEFTTTTGHFSAIVFATDSTCELVLPADETKLFPVGSWYYDIEVVPSTGEADTLKLMHGRFTVPRREITRD